MPARAKDVDMASEEHEHSEGLLHALTSLILRPVRPFVSRAAWRTYLAAFLLASTAIILLWSATVAYVFFYYSYVPRIGFERTIHLQFDHVFAHAGVGSETSLGRTAHPYPYGNVALTPDMVGAQPYDVKIELVMPRTRDNTNAGNFMLEVNMYAAGGMGGIPGSTGNVMEAVKADISPTSAEGSAVALLASSRRSAILPYRSWIVEILYRATELHWYLFGIRSETTTLMVPVYEKIAFPKGRANIPASLRLEIQSISRMQIYSAKVLFRARFQGLRWLMYNHRIISAILFIGGFWTTELVFAGLAWGALALRTTNQVESGDSAGKVQEIADRVKKEEYDEDSKPAFLSDTERTFPTLSNQQPLHYTSPPEAGLPEVLTIKREDDEAPLTVPEAIARAAEADDEDEDEDVDFFDSGIGTSLDSSGPVRTDSVRRRRGKGQRGRDPEERPF